MESVSKHVWYVRWPVLSVTKNLNLNSKEYYLTLCVGFLSIISKEVRLPTYLNNVLKSLNNCIDNNNYSHGFPICHIQWGEISHWEIFVFNAFSNISFKVWFTHWSWLSFRYKWLNNKYSKKGYLNVVSTNQSMIDPRQYNNGFLKGFYSQFPLM